MKLRRLVSIVVAGACALVPAAVVAPAAHADGSRISSIDFVRLYESDLHLVRVRVQAFDAGGAAIPFTGVFELTNTYMTSAYPNYAQSTETLDTAVASADGAPDVFTVDIRHLHQWSLGAVPSFSLTAAGDSSPYSPSGVHDSQHMIALATPDGTDLKIPGVQASDTVVLAGDVRSAQAVLGSWPCDEMDLTFGKPTCVVNTPTTGTESWQRGAKLSFHWTPLQKADGTFYRRCLLSPDLGVNSDWEDGVPGRTDQSPDIDVPGSWSGYTLPLDSVNQLVAVDFGKTTITWFLSCYDSTSDQLWGHVGQADQVPDLPPSQPTTASVVPEAAGVTVTAAGSRQLGVAKVLGYTAQLVDAGGATVATVHLPAAGGVQAAAVKRPTASIARVKPGRYHVVVSAFNRIGSSFTLSSRTITVAKRLGAPTHVSVHRVARTLRVAWSAPKLRGAGIARYRIVVRHGSHVVSTASLSAGKRSWHLAHAPGGRLRVTVEAVARNGAAASVVRG